jgi:hypothetical protein
MSKIVVRENGITTKTPDNILLGAGTVYSDLEFVSGSWMGNILGATSGGNKLSIVPEYSDMEIDGTSVAVEGLTNVKVGETASIETNLVELTPELIARAVVAGISVDEDVPGWTKVSTKPNIETGDYYDKFGFVGRKSDGSQIVIIFGRALCTGGMTLETKNKEKSTFPVTFQCVAPLSDEGVDYSVLPIEIWTKDPEILDDSGNKG